MSSTTASLPNFGKSSVTDTVTNSVSDAVDSAKQTASKLGDRVRQQVSTNADKQREATAAGLTNVAEAVRHMGETLKESQDQSPVLDLAAHYGDSLASQVEQAANYLRTRNVGTILGDLENLGRRRPATFLAGAFVLGLLGSRFLKSSRPMPDFNSQMPDPRRALPPASYPAGSLPSWPRSAAQPIPSTPAWSSSPEIHPAPAAPVGESETATSLIGTL